MFLSSEQCIFLDKCRKWRTEQLVIILGVSLLYLHSPTFDHDGSNIRLLQIKEYKILITNLPHQGKTYLSDFTIMVYFCIPGNGNVDLNNNVTYIRFSLA